LRWSEGCLGQHRRIFTIRVSAYSRSERFGVAARARLTGTRLVSCQKFAPEYFSQENSLRIRGNIDTATTGQFSTILSLTGALIRYGFYFVAAIVLSVIGVVMIWILGNRIKTVDDKPAFHLADSSIANLPTSSQIVTGGRLGRAEVIHYGTLHNRSTDLTIVMVLPPNGVMAESQLGVSLRETGLLGGVRPVMLPNFYDLETRFGAVRAMEMRVDADGRWKQCLAFQSRFDNPAIYLMGWSCDATGAQPSASALACTLDTFKMDGKLASTEADAFMRARMNRPANCSAQPVSQTYDTRIHRVSPPSRWSRPTARTHL
jgi:hypothetical protein